MTHVDTIKFLHVSFISKIKGLNFFATLYAIQNTLAVISSL
jgi:hypothetical protein